MAGFPSVKKGNKIGEKAKRPKPGMPFDKNVIEELIVTHQGNLSRVADAIGSSRGAIRNFVDRHPDTQQLLKDQRERMIDQLEESVFDRAISSNDTGLQAFLLKTQARHRGYDQDEAKNAAKDIATAAFDFIIKKQQEQSKT
jgi:hypothetical protein